MFVEVTAVTLLSLLLLKTFCLKHNNFVTSFYFSASCDILEEAESWVIVL